MKPAERKAKVSKVAADSWKGVDRGLFETLRKLRKSIAAKKSVPAYVVFGDASLRDMARRKPVTLDDFLNVKGVGQKKCKQYGKTILEVIKDYRLDNPVETNA